MENTIFELSFWDYFAFFGYFVLLSFIGYWYGRKKDESSADYFLAGRTLPWYVVGSSYIAANISTEHFIGLIGAAVIYGISVATGEWSTVIAFTFLIWLFVPYLLTSKVYTTPEYLELRFNKSVRVIFAVVSVLANIFAFMGPVIYGGSLILIEFFGLSPILSCFIIGITTGGWAIWGGLKSVAFMDVLTILIMVFGGLTVTILGLTYLGDGNGILPGFSKMLDVNSGGVAWAKEWIDVNVPNILKGAQQGDSYNRLSVIQPLNHYSNPWTHWVFSFFYIGLWYTVVNQTMVQKIFAAKNMYHARAGMVLASFLKLLLPVIVVIPGLIFFAMKPEFLSSTDWSFQSEQANKTYIVMINILVPTFMKGILLAALFGAIQSTVSSVLNSTSTMFTMDLYQDIYKKNETQEHYISVGKVSGLLFLLLSVGFAVLLATVTKVNLFILIQALYTFIAPPFSAIFLLGMLWKRVNGKDALITIFSGFAMAGFLKFLEFGPLQDSVSEFANAIKPFANQGLITWTFSMVVCVVSAFLTSKKGENLIGNDLVFNIKGEALREGLGDKWYNRIFSWWLLCVLILVFIIIFFSVIV
ncbi:solute:Na+ symporter, SSS family [Flavobacterium flevense]|uniref:Transporter n=1 Tax=Flavobacterium flevense TaxID=983 RepID=A0A4Y4AWT2_9FLAO|nr:sodium/solute symporter [Flavobacterium flevense]GEC72576.1 transporter [Flavobacterium flevense]SHM15733.1 solute:Na+ symporter, SSS family [Flavobacterium flevense]